LDLCLGPALAQLKSLIGPDMEERSRKDGSEVCKHFSDESEGGRSSGREHVAVRDFDHVLELLILKRQVQVPEGLLLRDDHHVILLGKVNEFSGFLRSNGAARSCR